MSDEEPARGPSEGSVQALVAAAARGDHGASAQLYRRYRAYVASVVVPSIPSELATGIDVEDLLQAAFLSAFAALPQHRFVDETRFRGWLREIALNKLRDKIRRDRRDGGGAHDPLSDTQIEARVSLQHSGDSPSAILSRAETEAQLSAALLELDPDERRTIQLRCFERRTWPEIAGELGLSDDGARRRYDEAIAELWRRLR